MTTPEERLTWLRERINTRLSVYRDKLNSAAETHEHQMQQLKKHGTHANLASSTSREVTQAFWVCDTLEEVLRLFDEKEMQP